MTVLSPEQVASRERTLLAAVLLSMWAPLVTGLAVLTSDSTTQVADFTRRTVELIALVISWQVFRRTERHDLPDPALRARLERTARLCVAAAMCCSGLVALALAVSRIPAFQPGGNVHPGLAIAFLGLITNAWFWRRYAAMGRESFNSVIDSQRQMYRAKVFVDLCVIIALGAVAVAPSHPYTRYVDLLGSVAVAGYLLWSGVRAALGRR